VYDERSFTDWLSGKPDERYDRYKFYPAPGDIFKIDEIGLVHTAVGCILEEFATVSTDMVDRLHDQNAGKPVPPFFNRQYFNDRLQSISFPDVARQVEIRSSDRGVTIISPMKIRGGRLIPIAQSSVIASRYILEPFERSDLYQDQTRAASLYIARGKGRVIIGEASEARALTPPTIPVSKGDLLMVPAGIDYGFINEDNEELEVSEQRIPLDVAFTSNSSNNRSGSK
jgi:mannose-6-phosphate isomerase-like protein (cupin superfamily)